MEEYHPISSPFLFSHLVNGYVLCILLVSRIYFAIVGSGDDGLMVPSHINEHLESQSLSIELTVKISFPNLGIFFVAFCGQTTLKQRHTLYVANAHTKLESAHVSILI